MSTSNEWYEGIEALGERIKIARQRRHWSQSSMAERMGVSRQTVERLENGDRSVRIGILVDALRVLSQSVDDLDVLADPQRDAVALSLEIARAPHSRHKRRAGAGADPDFTI